MYTEFQVNQESSIIVELPRDLAQLYLINESFSTVGGYCYCDECCKKYIIREVSDRVINTYCEYLEKNNHLYVVIRASDLRLSLLFRGYGYLTKKIGGYILSSIKK